MTYCSCDCVQTYDVWAR